MNDYLRSNLRFLSGAVSVISAMALFFLVIAWVLGGTPYFKDVLLGETFLPILAALIAVGAIAESQLRDRKARPAGLRHNISPACDKLAA